jgi:hypothetical protein
MFAHPALLAVTLAALASDAVAQDAIDAAIGATRATAAEERWRTIPWLTSLRAALQRGQTESKPVFFFAYDGILDTGNS